MSNIQYIEIPLETDPDILAQEGFDFIQSKFPDWVPNDGNLDTVIVEALARITAEARDVASAVPTDIFRYFGQLVGVLPLDATKASTTSLWTAIGNAGYTIPAGTQIGIVTSGNELVPFETIVDIVIPNGSTTASGVYIQAIEAGVDGSGLAIGSTVQLLDNLDFIASITLEAATTGGQDEESDDDYLDRLSRRLQLLAPRPILARDFAVLALDIAGVGRAVGVDGYNPFHNYLTANQSSVEVDVSGWQSEANCVTTRITSQHLDGVAALSMACTIGGDMTARTTPSQVMSPGDVFSAVASFRANTTGRTCRVMIRWYSDVGGTTLISDSVGSAVADTNAGWIQSSLQNAIAPINAVSCRVLTFVAAPGTSEVHYVDNIQLRRGSGIDWVIGGTPESGNERTVGVVALDPLGEPVSSGIKISVDTYLQSLRETNFIVNVTDATYTTIDVQFVVKAVDNYDTTLVHDAVVASITDFLSPSHWGLPDVATVGDLATSDWINKPIVRYLELAQAINEVGGVDYITTLTLRSGSNSYDIKDVNLGGTVALPRPGSVTGTVS